MENQSPTQNKSNLDDVKSAIKNNLNYIAIALIMIGNALVSLLTIENGEIALNLPSGPLAWILWASQIVLSTFAGVMILLYFRRQGIKVGHEKIKDTYSRYLEASKKHTKQKQPRSLKQYMTKKGVKDIISKSILFSFTSLVVGTLLISANLNNLLSLIITSLLAVAFGIVNMLDAEMFCVEELVIWYEQKIKELEGEEENVILPREQRNKSRSTKSSRV